MYPCPYTLIPSSVINIPNQSGTLVTTDDQVTHHYQTRSTVYIKVHSCCTVNELGQIYNDIWASQAVLVVKNLPANAGDIRDAVLIPGLGRSSGGGHGNPPVFSPGEFHGQRSLAAIVHRVTKSQTQLK